MTHTTSVRVCTLTTLTSLLISAAAAVPAAADTISLAWNASSELTVVGYMLHVGTQSGTYTQHVDAGLSTTYTWPGAVAGQRYCFTVSAYAAGHLEGPKSNEVCGYSNAYPVLVNPGARSSTVGQPTSLQLQGSDPDGRPVTYSHDGLPPGMSLMSSTGYIAGTPTTVGTYTITVSVSDGVLSAQQTFPWTITSQDESDTTSPAVTITDPTAESNYSVSSPTIDISGTAGDDVGIVQVVWTTNRGGSGPMTGTATWTASVPLKIGWNVITVTALDAAGNIATDVLSVRRRRH